MRRGLAAAGSALVLLAGAGGAHAGPPGSWTQVSGRGQPEAAARDVGLARTADGALQVLHTRERGRRGEVLHTALSANARRLSGPRTVASFGGGVNGSVALVRGPGGLLAFFAGVDEGSPFDRVMATASSADGRSWTPPAAASSVQSPRTPFAASGIGAALGLDGTPYSAWGSPGSGWHAGLDPALPDGDFPSDAVSDPGVGVDSASGRVVLAWTRLERSGMAARSIAPLAGPVGIPGSGAAQTLHRVAVTGRVGAPGVFVAYTAGENQFTGRAAVWRFGARRGRSLSGRGARHSSIAAGPAGRLWAFWDRDGRIYARRSNRAATAFGAAVSIPAPRRTRAIHALAGEGSRGPLDVLALVERRGGDTGNWHQRIRPGIALRARGERGAVTFFAADAGKPLRRVRVTVEGVGAARTGAGGTARFELPPGSYRATATRKGYSPASARVRVR